MIVFVLIVLLVLLFIFLLDLFFILISNIRRTQHQIKKNQEDIRQIINQL